MTEEQQKEIAELARQIEATLDAHKAATAHAEALEQAVKALTNEARALRERRAEAAKQADAANVAAAQAWATFRSAEARLKAAQRRAGLKVTGAPDTLLQAYGIASAEAVGQI